MVAIALASAMLGGCASYSSGPLQFEGTGGDYCGDTELRQFGVGIDLGRSSGGDITIDEVTSTRSDGLEIIGAVVVDRPSGGVATSEWPLKDTRANTRDAIGAVIPAKQEAGIVVGVRRTGQEGGTIGTVQIHYSEGGRAYVAATYVTIRMSPGC